MSQPNQGKPPIKPPLPNIKGVAAPETDGPAQRKQAKRASGRIRLSDWVEDNTQNMLSLIGYGLLGFALIDYIDILVPARLMNPQWELQAITALVAKVWAPLFGLMLVFCRRKGSLGKREMNLLNIFSWAALGLAIIYFALIPLSIGNAFRLSQNTTQQLTNQLNQQTSQLDQYRRAVDQANTPADLGRIFAPNQPTPNIPDPQAAKQELLTQIEQYEQEVNTNTQLNIQSTRRNLIKRTVINGFTCLLAGWLFFKIWRFSLWARQWKRFAS
ncbi:hypothetical protein Pse7367_3296 [Thalassoporum mexicanum PCC 7367]|uniref:HpsJ-like protein, cyanoexosortase A-associated n=1 Tax=Thalassoporum mexicanum TaxID=3457544 RepID=UPI00029F8729|nr:HpsJ family protein [Pseudanabaena sp. PCC 7367]AFY71536.1 hypothetical protein Pse7367_3296 [Pseudanabaena sp. PCC 7367]